METLKRVQGDMSGVCLAEFVSASPHYYGFILYLLETLKQVQGDMSGVCLAEFVSASPHHYGFILYLLETLKQVQGDTPLEFGVAPIYFG